MEPITMRRGFPGAKPAAVAWWIFEWLNLEPGDEFVDLFPGSGAIGEAHRAWLDAQAGATTGGLFDVVAEGGRSDAHAG